MNSAKPVLTTVLFVVAYGVVCELIGRGAIPAQYAHIVGQAALAGVIVLIFWLVEELTRAQIPAPAPAGKPDSGTPGLPKPADPPVQHPGTIKPRNTDITATDFGGSEDPNTSAYDDHFINDTELTASLPARVSAPRGKLRVFLDDATCDCDVGDVGPWNTNDPYWTTGARPAAEAQFANGTKASNGRVPTNPAGIDLSPGVWKKLGHPGLGKAKVDWDWVSYLDATKLPPAPPSPVATASGAAIIAIVTALDGTHWTDGNNPTIDGWIETIAAKWPDLAAYARSLEDHGYFAWCGLTCAYVMTKAGFKPPSQFYMAADWLNFGTKVDTPQPGDVLIYQWHGGSDAGGHHVSIYDHETDGDYYASHGGNQSHTVNITQFPMSACVGIRRPA